MSAADGEDCEPEEVAAVRRRACPDCGFGLVEGPHGGLSVNWYCENQLCGSRFNDMGPFGVQRISEACPRREEQPQ